MIRILADSALLSTWAGKRHNLDVTLALSYCGALTDVCAAKSSCYKPPSRIVFKIIVTSTLESCSFNVLSKQPLRLHHRFASVKIWAKITLGVLLQINCFKRSLGFL